MDRGAGEDVIATPCPPAAVAMVKAAPAAYPASANLAGGDSIVHVAVSVGADGRVTGAKVTASSGHPDADGSALAAAKASSYTPASRNCAAVAGTYVFTATFTAPVTKSSEVPPAKIR